MFDRPYQLSDSLLSWLATNCKLAMSDAHLWETLDLLIGNGEGLLGCSTEKLQQVIFFDSPTSA